ncbi:MAG: alpha-hydroxy acid oxidase [Bacteroidota bacterium]
MKDYFNNNYPDISYLQEQACRRIPGFVFDYLEGGCLSEINLAKNTAEIRTLELEPFYLRERKAPNTKVSLFGKSFDLPFGVAPVGLQGLIWPGATEILAKASKVHNIPYILSTVGTASIERVSELAEDNTWFQLYNPIEESLQDEILNRLRAAQIDVLVVLADVPSFGYRAKEIRNGLSIPPKLSFRNLVQICSKPSWVISTLRAGVPKFQTLAPYLPKGINLHHLGLFMNKTFSGVLTQEILKKLRDKWPGKLVVKGISTYEDYQKVVAIGADGVIVSNHGGRQLDSGRSSISSLQEIIRHRTDRLPLMIDSGIRNGSDVANCLTAGADFTFMGRTFMYGVGALGTNGGHHTINLLKKQLVQVMHQVGANTVAQLPAHRVNN